MSLSGNLSNKESVQTILPYFKSSKATEVSKLVLLDMVLYIAQYGNYVS